MSMNSHKLLEVIEKYSFNKQNIQELISSEYFEENIKPEAPALVLFPSNYAYAHRAMPVIKGTKYAIVTWLGHPFDLDGMPPMYQPQGGN